MKSKRIKVISVLLVLALLVSSLVFSVNAEEDFTWETYDKGYITIVFDDGKMPITQQAAEIFEEFGMPMSAAIPAKLVEYDNELYHVLMDIQDNGGEILSHGYNHIPIVDTTNPEYASKTNNAARYIDTSSATAVADMDYELGESWRKLNNLGFNVNGMIQVGCGGAEGTADFELVESVARKYYKYSDGSGVSPQYKLTRRSASWDTLANLKKRIDNAATNKTWQVLYVHSFKEITSDASTEDGAILREVLQYIKDKNGAVEVVTYNGMYNAFGKYTGPAVPTADALASLDSIEVKDYYVMSTGHDGAGTAGDGRSQSTPAATVADAIATAKSDGLGKGDVANVYILQEADGYDKFDTTTSKTLVSGNKTYYKHNMTAWADGINNTITEHDFKLVVKSPEGQQNHLAYNSYVANTADLYLGGDTAFENVTIVGVRKWQDQPICTNGYDMTLSDSTKLGFLNTDSVTTFGGVSTQTLPIQLRGSESAKTFDKEININLNTAYTGTGTARKAGLHLVTYDGGSGINYNKDVNITIDNANAVYALTWGGYTTASSVNFNKSLNINIKNAKTIKRGLGTNNDYATGSITVAGGLQIIYPSSASFEDLTETFEAKNIKNYYILENTSGNPDLLTFAIDPHGNTIPGNYKVPDGYAVTATGENGTYTASNGRLVIAKPGKYTITASKTYDFYVKSMGATALENGEYNTSAINGAGTKANPAATILDVIKIANAAGLKKGDVANVYIIQRNDWNQYDGSLIGKNSDGTFSIPHHNMTAWAHSEVRDDNKTPDTHEWTMVIKGDTASSTTDSGRIYLTYGDRLGTNHSLNIGGPTVFENVTITMMRSSRDRAVYFNNKDVTFSSNTTYGYINNSYHTTSKTAWDGKILTSATASLPNSLLAEGVNTAQNGMTVNINNSYTGTLHVLSSGSGSYRNVSLNGDININVNNSKATPQLAWSVSGSNTKHTLKTVNIHVLAGKITNSAGTVGSNSKMTANAVQAIVEKDATLTGLDTTLATLGISNYYVLNNTGDSGMIDFMRDENGDAIAGQFKILGDTAAIAANSQGSVVAVSADGVLKITTPGIYEIRFINAYDNDGRTLTIYEPSQLDLSLIEHEEIEGKVFIGWAFSDGTYPAKVQAYKYGDVLTAQYVNEADINFNTEEFQVRDDGNDGDPSLRFIHSINKDVLPNVSERGTLMLPLSQSYGYEMFLDEKVIYTYGANKDVAEFNVATTGATPNKISGENILYEDEDTLKYTICITGITKENYTTSYAVRAYVKYADNNGIEGIYYAEQEVPSLYEAAAESAEQTDSEKAIVNYVEGDRIANYWLANGLTADGKITANTTAQYIDAGCGCFGTANCDHKLFTVNDGKLYVRDVIIDTGLSVEESQFAFITDTHFNSVNKMDLAENSVALSSYRGRPESWRNHQRQYFSHGINEFVSMFTKTVNGGDVMDYLSWGAVYSVDRILTKQSVANRLAKKLVSDGKGGYTLQNVLTGSMGMVFGNHDPKQLSSPVDNSLKESRTLEERYAMVDPHWTNELYYDSEILLDSKGNENVMMVYLDNSQYVYSQSQYNALNRDLEYAKANGIPVLIFQHIPMLTMNENEKEWKYLDGFYNYNKIVPQDNKYYDIAGGKYTIKEGYIGAGTAVNVYDMTSYTGYLGNKNNDATTLSVYNLIRQNSSVIKGVFAGHIHAHTKSEIVGIDANGNPDGTYIPQYTGYLASQRGVMRITVK